MNTENIFILFFVLLIFIIYIAIVYFLSVMFDKYLIYRFKKALIKGITHKTIKNIEDVSIIYNGSRNTNNLNDRKNLNRILKRLIFDLTLNFEKNNNDLNAKKDIIICLNNLLEENNNYSPFLDLPTQERILFDDLLKYLNHNDIDAARSKVDEISNLFVIYNEKKLKSDRFAKISFGLAIISTILTILSIFI